MRKRLVRTLIVSVVTVLALLGCASQGSRTMTASQDEGAMRSDFAFAPEPAPAMEMEEAKASYGGDGETQGAGIPGAANVERKIIYTVGLDLIVEDTEVAFKEVQRLAEEMGGFVANSNMWRQDEHPRGSLTVRVPADALEDALESFRALAVDVEGQQVDSQDVTEEYVDLEARLENEQRTERELQELLESRSALGKTSDILEVHRELNQVRGQIEQIQGRMTYLENLSAMATVHISLTPDELVQPVVVAGWRPQGTARKAIRMLLNTLQFLADAAITFFLYILPVLIVIAIPIVGLYLIVRALVRRSRRRRSAKSAG